MALRFEDVHSYAAGGGYEIPNEQFLLWRLLLKEQHVDRAAGICSAGEVGFFSILPLVEQELVLVDHAYVSLSYAMTKFLLLEKLGADRAYELFTSGDAASLGQEVDSVLDQLPNPIQALIPSSFARRAGSYKRIWAKTPREFVQEACSKLDKVLFVHGDLTDLAEKGPFDVLYLSNALEHSSRTRQQPIVADVVKAVRPGGLVLSCWDRYSKGTKTADWEEVQSIDGDGGDRDEFLRWKYLLNRLPEAA